MYFLSDGLHGRPRNKSCNWWSVAICHDWESGWERDDDYRGRQCWWLLVRCDLDPCGFDPFRSIWLFSWRRCFSCRGRMINERRTRINSVPFGDYSSHDRRATTFDLSPRVDSRRSVISVVGNAEKLGRTITKRKNREKLQLKIIKLYYL